MKYFISLITFLFVSIASAQISGPMFPGPGAASSGGGGFTNLKSILNDGAGSKSITRTQGTGTSRTLMTFNFWYRTDDVSTATTIITSSNANVDVVAYLASVGGIGLILNSGAAGLCTGVPGGGFLNNIYYQITVQIDTAKGTIANGCKILINNLDVTSVAAPVTTSYATGWGLNADTETAVFETTVALTLVDEFSKIDGSIQAPTAFATANLPINIASLSFGAQGYWIRFETGVDTTVGQDYSGVGNNFTNSGFINADFSTTVP